MLRSNTCNTTQVFSNVNIMDQGTPWLHNIDPFELSVLLYKLSAHTLDSYIFLHCYVIGNSSCIVCRESETYALSKNKTACLSFPHTLHCSSVICLCIGTTLLHIHKLQH